MGKVADILLEFDLSPSENVSHHEITVNAGGVEQKFTIDNSTAHIELAVSAPSTMVVTSESFDTDGDKTSSVVFTYVVGDGVGPIPLSNFRAKVVGYREVVDTPVDPEDPGTGEDDEGGEVSAFTRRR